MISTETITENITVTDQLSRILADEILMGRIPPGSHLNESSLATRFSVSRTPVREALGQIIAFGLAERRPHHGVYVIATTTERLADMFELSADLEGNCARHAARRMSDEEKNMLKISYEDAQQTVVDEDEEKYELFNLQFHEQICKGCQNPYLIEAANVARIRVMPYRRAQFRARKRVKTSHHEHEVILKAIFDSDGDLAEHLMRNHLVSSFKTSQTMLRQLFGGR